MPLHVAAGERQVPFGQRNPLHELTIGQPASSSPEGHSLIPSQRAAGDAHEPSAQR